MLLVKHRLGPSPIAGLGVFAAEPIEKGRAVWQFHELLDVQIGSEHYRQLHPVQQSYLDVYAYLSEGVYVLCGDHARFMNHAAEPNTVEEGSLCLAARDIAVGEELTCNYFNFDELAGKKLGMD